jgi:hypothetical protein
MASKNKFTLSRYSSYYTTGELSALCCSITNHLLLLLDLNAKLYIVDLCKPCVIKQVHREIVSLFQVHAEIEI